MTLDSAVCLSFVCQNLLDLGGTAQLLARVRLSLVVLFLSFDLLAKLWRQVARGSSAAMRGHLDSACCCSEELVQESWLATFATEQIDASSPSRNVSPLTPLVFLRMTLYI